MFMDGGDGHDGDHGGFNMGSIQSLGIINALKTGDPKLDTILALLMPFALNFLLKAAAKVAKFISTAWAQWWGPHREIIHYHERTITHRSQYNTEEGYMMELDGNDAKNSVLLKALRLYLHANVDLNLTRADMTLMAFERCYSRTETGMLRSYTLLKNPPVNEWHKLGLYGDTKTVVELRVEDANGSTGNNEDQGDGSDNKKVQVTQYRLRSLDGSAIDDFIDKAYEWHIEELQKSEGIVTRYFYEPQITPSHSSSQQQGRRYTRFELSSEKTFESLFFPDKNSVLKLVGSFLNKEGKYAIKGYPHKLGILLHGPPGTGKTSFIKALAEHTGRNIVNVPLAKIATNAELTSMFFDKKYIYEDHRSVNMDFEDVIFVMEDIDAASDVVKRRDGKKTAQVIQTSHIDIPAPKSLWHMLLESEGEDCQTLVEILMQKSKRLREEATKPEIVCAATKRMTALPALGFVGETDDKTLQKLSDDAISSSEALMKQYTAVDTFLGFHAKRIERLLDENACIDETLVDSLLGVEPPSLPPLIKRPLSRDVSYSKYDGSDEVYMEMKELQRALTEKSSTLQEKQGSKKNTPGSLAMLGSKSPYVGSRSPYRDFLKNEDELNLSGILNVLDGVVDTPARIVIMTTNHPEHLDPALIRPGRVDKKLFLGYMSVSDISDMLEHYFETTVDETQRMRLATVIEGDPGQNRPKLNLTPAQVEQLTSEFETVDDMMVGLEEKASLITPTTSRPRSGTISSTEMTFGV